MPYPYSLDDYINEVKEYIYKNGLKKPSVVAHSFGARIAIKAASYNEDIFDKLVLTGAAGLKPRFSLKKSAKKSAFDFLKKFLPKERLSAFYSSDYRALSDIMKKSFILIVNENLDDRIKFIKNPTLLVFGEKDRETPLYMARKLLKDLQNGRLVTVKNAGHFCFTEKPNNFNTEVKEFLLS